MLASRTHIRMVHRMTQHPRYHSVEFAEEVRRLISRAVPFSTDVDLPITPFRFRSETAEHPPSTSTLNLKVHSDTGYALPNGASTTGHRSPAPLPSPSGPGRRGLDDDQHDVGPIDAEGWSV